MNDQVIKYLGVDWGEKRIGLALGNSEAKMATPFKVVGGLDEVLLVIKEEEIDLVVLGEPLRMQNGDGIKNLEFRMQNTGNKMQDEFLEFLELLNKKARVPVKLIDERLSSKAADSLAGDKKTKAPRDAVAAMLILQTYLDREVL